MRQQIVKESAVSLRQCWELWKLTGVDYRTTNTTQKEATGIIWKIKNEKKKNPQEKKERK